MSAISINEDRLFNELSAVPDAQERLAVVAERGRRSVAFSATEKIEGNRVPGCASQVWLIGIRQNAQCFFRADAESPVLKGLILLLADVYNGAEPVEILSAHSTLLERLQLKEQLSPTRRHGLDQVEKRIIAIARSFQLPL